MKLSDFNHLQVVRDVIAANSLIKDGWRLIEVSTQSNPIAPFNFLMGCRIDDPLEQSKRIAADLKAGCRLRHVAEWDFQGEPKERLKLSRTLGRLIAGLKKGREIRLSREDGKSLNLRVFQDGRQDESYTPDIFNDLPMPTEELID